MSVTTDNISCGTGIGSAFVGIVFLGVAMFLPETANLIILVRLKIKIWRLELICLILELLC